MANNIQEINQSLLSIGAGFIILTAAFDEYSSRSQRHTAELNSINVQRVCSDMVASVDALTQKIEAQLPTIAASSSTLEQNKAAVVALINPQAVESR